MSSAGKFNQGKKRPAAGKPAPGKIGRDFLAVLFLGLGIGAAIAMTGVDATKSLALVQSAAVKVQQLAAEFAHRPDDGKDQFPVSSIAREAGQSDSRSERVYEGHYPVCSYAVATRRNCVIDGDTFHLGGTTIRISDIDAPETHPPRCAREADLGDRATTRLSRLLSAGPFQLVRDGRDLDRHGRQLRVVMRNGQSIGAMLVEEGLARKWTGKHRPWCPSGPST